MLTLIVFGMTIHCASPLVDSLSIQYMNHGVKMNYAISRARFFVPGRFSALWLV